MRREAWSGTLAALVMVATIGIAAQSTSPPQNPSEPTPQPPTEQAPAASPPQSSDANRITVNGCLQEAPSTPVGTSGSAAAAPSDAAGAAPPAEATSSESNLVLANAAPPAAETAAASDSSAPRTYRLIANEAALKPHLGKKLQLSGTVEESSPDKGPALRVEAGKVIAEACTP